MRRDPALLQLAVAPLTADLRATLGPGWSCRLVNGAAVRLSDGEAVDVTGAMAETFDPEDELPVGALASPWRDRALEEGAEHALAEVVQHLVAEAVGPWPRCPLHPDGAQLVMCSAVWVCPSPAHEVAPLGGLPSG